MLRKLASHKFVLLMVVLIAGVLAIEYHRFLTPRTYSQILGSQTLRVGYIKAPDVAYSFNGKHYGYEYDLLKEFADSKGLSIELIALNYDELKLALNMDQVDIAIGSFSNRREWTSFARLSSPWDSQTLVVVEQRKKDKPRIKDISDIEHTVYTGPRMNLPAGTFKPLDEDLLKHAEEAEIGLLGRVSRGEIKYAISSLGRLRVMQKYYPRLRRVATLDKRIDLVWLFPQRADSELVRTINLFLGRDSTRKLRRELAERHYQTDKNIHYLDTLAIHKHIRERLPKYEKWFRQAAAKYGMDWTLLAAVAYQESNWKVDAVSPTKVRGLMQITTETANELGVENRLDPKSTIFAAAKYLTELESRVPERVRERDRIWLAVGAYNVGFTHILRSYKSARSARIQKVTWKNLASYYLPYLYTFNQDSTFVRGAEAVKYVARIQEFDRILRYYAAD